MGYAARRAGGRAGPGHPRPCRHISARCFELAAAYVVPHVKSHLAALYGRMVCSGGMSAFRDSEVTNRGGLLYQLPSSYIP